MFGFSKKQTNPKLDDNIELVLDEMKTIGPDAPEYPELLTSLERLEKVKKPEGESRRVSPDTVWIVLGNVACVVVIVMYEQKHVMRSAATTFVARLTNRAPRSTL